MRYVLSIALFNRKGIYGQDRSAEEQGGLFKKTVKTITTMPNLKITRFEITPEQFLNACSPEEIIELNLLLQSPKYTTIINQLNLFKGNGQLVEVKSE